MTPIESLLKLLLKPNARKGATPKISFPQLAELALSGNDNKLAIEHYSNYDEDDSLLFLRYLREHQDRDERLIILENLTK